MKRSQSMVGLVLLVSIGFPKGAIAQAVPDGTVGTSVNAAGNSFTISGGMRSGNNLFHSFSQFSIPTNGSGIFNNATDVQNIFSRVTGSSASSIDGLIKANGNASLFLMNPNGIVFGPKATLNIGGSFIGTTANSIKFGDGLEFSSGNLTANPLLSVKVPIGLQMGQNSGGITVQGRGHNAINQNFGSVALNNTPSQLQVGAGNTLALIGGVVNFSAGIASVNAAGHLEIGSVQTGTVKLNPNAHGQGLVGDYSSVTQFNDIHLEKQSLLNVNGSNNSIRLQGHNISLTEGSAILLQNFGTQPSEGITVNATGSLQLTGVIPDGSQGSFIITDNFGVSQTGDIKISANQLVINDGGIILNQTFVPEATGNIIVNVHDMIQINGVAPTNVIAPSSIATLTFNSKKAGNITISTGNLSILNGGNLVSSSFDSGQAGMIQVDAADLIEIVGNAPISLGPSTITSTTLGSGNSSDLLINASRLIIRDGGAIGSSTLNTGSAGNVIVNASTSINVNGTAIGSIQSSRIVSNTDILDPVTQALFGLPAIPSGDSGSITLNTPLLQITNGAAVTVQNDGPGLAGDLYINAHSLLLDNHGTITASTVSGNGGNIELNLQDHLLMRHNSVLSATTTGTGDGGNIFIHSPILVGLENSDVIANAVNGKGGTIKIKTQSILGLKYRDRLTPDNDITASSDFGINGSVQVNTIGINPTNALNALPTNIHDSGRQIADRCAAAKNGSFVSTGRGGIPKKPIQRVTHDRPWNDLRPIITTNSTPIQPIASAQPITQLVEASAIEIDETGAISLVAPQNMNSNPATCALSS
jgi:filamentous hemagglutinin family protein